MATLTVHFNPTPAIKQDTSSFPLADRKAALIQALGVIMVEEILKKEGTQAPAEAYEYLQVLRDDLDPLGYSEAICDAAEEILGEMPEVIIHNTYSQREHDNQDDYDQLAEDNAAYNQMRRDEIRGMNRCNGR